MVQKRAHHFSVYISQEHVQHNVYGIYIYWTDSPVKLKAAFHPCNPHGVAWRNKGHLINCNRTRFRHYTTVGYLYPRDFKLSGT